MTASAGILNELQQAFPASWLEGTEYPALEPKSAEEVAEIVRWCREHHWRILPVGFGHTFPEQHHVPTGVLTVLSTARRGASEPSPWDLVIESESGVPARLLTEQVARAGYRLDGWPEDYPGTVGGLICGGRGHEVRRLVLGAVIVDGTGRAVHFGGAVRKDVSGFDIPGVFTGSRGTIGWLDRVTLRLSPASAASIPRALPNGTASMAPAGLYSEIVRAFDPENVFFKPEG